MGLLGSLSGAVGGLISSVFDAKEKGLDRDFNRDEARTNRDWQHNERIDAQNFSSAEADKNRLFEERMSSTAMQRAAIDAEKAGLNRILALGSPASSPGGNAPSSSAGSGSQAHSPGGTFTAGLRQLTSNAVEVKRMEKDLMLADKDAALKDAERETQRAIAYYNQQNAKKLAAEIPAIEAESKVRSKHATFGYFADKLGGIGASATGAFIGSRLGRAPTTPTYRIPDSNMKTIPGFNYRDNK